MAGDPLGEIMGYLGLEPPTPAVGSEPSYRPNEGHSGVHEGGDELLAAVGGATIWRTGNSSAQWIEVRGRFPTFRATGPKARLIVDVRSELDSWAGGGDPRRVDRDIAVSSARRRGLHVLEVSHGTWKPMRLTREQAAAVLRLIEHIDRFARDASQRR